MNLSKLEREIVVDEKEEKRIGRKPLGKERVLIHCDQIVKVTIKSRLVTVEGPRGMHLSI